MSDSQPADANSDLTDDELAMLAFEKSWWKYAGVKETTIRERFAMSPTRYYQALNALIEREAALAAEPLLVTRLRRRLRDERRAQRAQPRLRGPS